MKDYINKNFPHLIYGADYNPEQWADYPDILEQDMELMKSAHVNEMSVGIFSWAFLEPKEGEYDFSFTDEILDKIYENGGRVILATPSGSRPRWLVEKYPEVMRVTADGKRLGFRDRHNHCYTSPEYRKKVAAIDYKLAERYGNHPAVIAWHISNEYGGRCYCPYCRRAFVEFLRKRYDNDIHKLNEQYWSAFWGLKYDNFEQIEPPTDMSVSAINALYVDWERFVTEQTADFMQNEINAVKSACPNLPVTTNLMWKHHLNYWKIAEKLDFVSWDSYPEWKDPFENASQVAFWHDLFRSLKFRPFLLMESAPGLVNWMAINRLKRPNIDKLQSMQAIAHGSDSVQYFQFRKGRGGKEKFHGAIVDHAGSSDTRIFKIVKEVGETINKIDEIAGTGVKSKVAILFDWENSWAIQYATGFNNGNKKYTETCENYYRAFWKEGVNVDIINSEGNFSEYSIIVAPMLYSLSEKTIDKIEKYVKNGGWIYSTYMSGYVNENDLCYLGGFPSGVLKTVFGIVNEEIDSLYETDEYIVKTVDDKIFKGRDYCEHVIIKGAKTLATIQTEFGNYPALTVNEYGKGKAFYQSFRDSGEFNEYFLRKIVNERRINKEFDNLPDKLTVHTREDDKTVYVFIENYSEEEQCLISDRKYFDLLNGKIITEIVVKPLSVAVLRRDK